MTRARECGRKIRWRSAARAWAAAHRLIARDDEDMTVYRCRWCGAWHTGHRRPPHKEAFT